MQGYEKNTSIPHLSPEMVESFEELIKTFQSPQEALLTRVSYLEARPLSTAIRAYKRLLHLTTTTTNKTTPFPNPIMYLIPLPEMAPVPVDTILNRALVRPNNSPYPQTESADDQALWPEITPKCSIKRSIPRASRGVVLSCPVMMWRALFWQLSNWSSRVGASQGCQAGVA